MDPVDALPTAFRARANELEPYSPPAAVAFREAADTLAQALADAAGDALTLDGAAAASGYSADHLGRLVRAGRLRDVGRLWAPRILRGELPRKPRCATAAQGDTALAEVAPPGLADFAWAVDARHGKRG